MKRKLTPKQIIEKALEIEQQNTLKETYIEANKLRPLNKSKSKPKVKDKLEVKEYVPVRSIQHCSTKSCKGLTMNRDFNPCLVAAKRIFNISYDGNPSCRKQNHHGPIGSQTSDVQPFEWLWTWF